MVLLLNFYSSHIKRTKNYLDFSLLNKARVKHTFFKKFKIFLRNSYTIKQYF